MNLALVLLPEYSADFPYLAQGYLAASLRKAGHRVTLFDSNVVAYSAIPEANHRLWNKDAAQIWSDAGCFFTEVWPHVQAVLRKQFDQLLAGMFDVVAFSVFYTNQHSTRWMIRQLRAVRPTVKIIIGGPSADDPEFRQLNTCGVIDAIVKGEGEATIVELMHRIENHLPLKVATGTAFGPAREPADISMLPQPDLSDLASLPYVTDTQPIQFSRGCPARCAFCTERLLWPNFRRRSAESAVSEIENRLLRTTSRSFLAVDSLLNADLRWLEEVTDRLIARELDIKWGGNMRVHSRMRRKLFGQLRRAGMAHAVWGVESGSRRILRLMNKGIEPNTSLRNVRDCSNAGIITIINILVGFPGETRVDFQLTCELLARMWRHIDGINLSRFWPGVEFDWGIAPAVPVEMGDARKAVLEPAVAALIEESALREHVEGLLTPIVGPSRARNIALRRCRQSRPVLEQLCDWSRAC